MVIGHTGCGMEMFSEEEFENHLHTKCGVWAVAPDKFHFYTDVNRATQKQVLKLRSHPWIPSEVAIRGFVYHLATGELREITPKGDHDEAVGRSTHGGGSGTWLSLFNLLI